MRYRTREGSETRVFNASNPLFLTSKQIVLTEIGRVRFAANRSQRAPCARVYKRNAGGGVNHD